VASDPRTRIGRRGEQLAAQHLQRRGYDVIERNYRTREGEIDLIVATADTLIFCEVKTLIERGGSLHPLESVTGSKRARIRRVARSWLAEHASGGWSELRFDAIGVMLARDGELRELEHIESAF
jgi:putative endonuclease